MTVADDVQLAAVFQAAASVVKHLPVGSPAKATAASRGNSHTNQRCLRTFVAFKITNLLFVAIVVQLPKARFSLRK